MCPSLTEISIDLPDERNNDLPDRCIICLGKFSTHDADSRTDEHIIPRALSGNGEIIFTGATHKHCNGNLNERFEQKTLRGLYNIPRIILSLKRSKDKKRRAAPLISLLEAEQMIPIEMVLILNLI